jgi:hypothetical protein
MLFFKVKPNDLSSEQKEYPSSSVPYILPQSLLIYLSYLFMFFFVFDDM